MSIGIEKADANVPGQSLLESRSQQELHKPVGRLLLLRRGRWLYLYIQWLCYDDCDFGDKRHSRHNLGFLLGYGEARKLRYRRTYHRASHRHSHRLRQVSLENWEGHNAVILMLRSAIFGSMM